MSRFSCAGLSSLIASAAFAAINASAQRCAAAADCASLIALTSASFLVMIAAACAGAGITECESAVTATPMAEATKIARVDCQFIGFLSRSDAAAKDRSRTAKRPKNPQLIRKMQSLLFDILLGADKANFRDAETLRISQRPGHRIIFR